ncbi:MAG: hypothetical protein C0425_03405 [Chlorobiaceae bacterium]|nr:hypothetical protein [Chlorobiaceae bacterium]MBA4309362.1 hypothetical protein [Chlorobiaceae bacterium]
MKLLSIILLLTTLSFTQVVGPKIHSMNSTQDFGTIKQGEVINRYFIIANIGQDTLILQRIMTSCGCTVAEPEKRNLAPGESTKLKAEFNSVGRIGAQLRYITIASNDKETPMFRLTLKGEVVDPSVQIEKPAPTEAELTFPKMQLDLGKIREGDVVENFFAYENTGDKTLEIKDVKTTCGCTVSEVSKKILQKGETGKLKVIFDSKGRLGKMSRNISVSSNDPKEPIKVLTIFVEVLKREN